MDLILDAFVRSWPFAPWFSGSLLLSAGLYLRGWLILRRRDARQWQLRHLVFFLSGLAAIFLALASPIEPFAGLLLQVHMAQHLLLTMIAPPLLWLGWPLVPILRGLPGELRTYWIVPLLRSRIIRCCFQELTHPFLALPLFVVATWLWHVPLFYDLALRSTGWHYVQHVCFLGTAILFWYPVIRPYPSRLVWSTWLLFPYLIIADVQNTILSALLTFSDRVLYASYAEVPRLGRLSALEDQSAAGVLMWVPGSLVYLIPLFAIGIRLLSGARPRLGVRRERPGHLANQFIKPTRCLTRFDLMRIPLIGSFLRWRHARLALQLPLGALGGIVIYDGLFGPQVAPMNLAGVLPWIHWRGLVMFGLLAAGNISCMACPFTLPRTTAHRWLPASYEWPRWLKSKWLAVFLLVIFLWSYEAFSLWDRPYATALIALGYFIAALVVDGLFRGASFCKYVCPIGQFNFVQTLISPLEIKVRDPDVCATCRTHECIRGGPQTPGCAMDLFQPRKSSNMDCTFCLDCIHACPHENVGILIERPGKVLWTDPARSGIGRLGTRPDIVVLVLVLVFGAFANAAAMVAPVVRAQEQFQSTLGLSRYLMTSLYYVIVLLMVPALAVIWTAVLSRWWGQLGGSWLEVAMRFSYSLVPLGFGMWLSHYSFHFFGSYETLIPALQRFLLDFGYTSIGAPQWILACCRPIADWLPRMQIVYLDLGLLLSLYTGHRIALDLCQIRSRAVKTFVPWSVMIGLLFALGVWIILQPMQMRGTLPGA